MAIETIEPIPPIKGSREYFELKFKKCSFYWSFLEVMTEIQLEILEELRKKNGGKNHG